MQSPCTLAMAIDALNGVVSAAPVFVRPTLTQTAARAIGEEPRMEVTCIGRIKMERSILLLKMYELE